MPKMLQITARPATGFRRAGIHHPPTPVLHDPAKFTEVQGKALLAEPNLICVLVDVPEAAATEAKDPSDGGDSKGGGKKTK